MSEAVDALATKIIELVEQNPFVRINEVITQTSDYWASQGIDVIKIINLLIKSGEVQELEYIDSENIPNRIRSRLYPKRYAINGLRKK